MPTRYQLSVEALFEGVFIGNITRGGISDIATGTRFNGCAAMHLESEAADITLSNDSQYFFHFLLIIFASAGMVYLVLPDFQMFTTALY